MQLHVLFGQTPEEYPGQYAPEALEVMDNNGMDENAQWLYERRDAAIASKNYSSVAIVVINLDEDAVEEIERALSTTPVIISGTIGKPLTL